MVGRGCAVAQSPYGFVLNGHVIMLQNIYEFINATGVNALLNLIFCSSSNV
jgi:hypothetical protein